MGTYLEGGDEGMTECQECQGIGQVMVGAELLPSGHTEIFDECDECEGSGEVSTKKN